MPLNSNPSSTKPEHLTLFPTMGSVQDVIDYAESKLPINTKNDVVTLLGTYHNTLLKAMNATTRTNQRY